MNSGSGAPPPNRATQLINKSDLTEKYSLVQPMVSDGLDSLLNGIDELPSARHDEVLCCTLESVSQGVNLSKPFYQDLYLYSILRLPITSARAYQGACLAVRRCEAEGKRTSLIHALLASLIRSVRRGWIDPLPTDDLVLLVNSATEARGLSLVEALISEVELSPLRRFHTRPVDTSKVYQAVESAGYAFSDISDLLEQIELKSIEHPGCIKQVAVMLLSIFTRHQYLLESQMKSIAVATDKINYCPVQALPALMQTLHSHQRRTNHSHALVCLSNLDLSATPLKQLLNVITSLGQLYKLESGVLEGILFTLNKVISKVPKYYSDQEVQYIRDAILGFTLEIAKDTQQKGGQLHLVEFIENLYTRGFLFSTDIYTALIENAASVSVPNNLRGLLLRIADEQLEKPDHSQSQSGCS